ncbi:MAG: NADH-quinone oxidoreductase subunit C [Bacillota bacterium]
MDKTTSLEEIITLLVEKYEGRLERVEDSLDAAIRVKDQLFFQVAKELKEEHGLDFLTDLTALDLGEGKFRGIYHLMSWKPYRLLRIEVDASGEEPWLPSITELWPAANVQEREVFDMFGIIYDGHPNLTRILLSEDFEGHPLRKSYVTKSRRK